MFALVQSNQIKKYFLGNKGVTIGDTQYPKTIFTLWNEEERNAIGIYTVVFDNSSKKDDEWYINTDISYSFSNNTVVGSYGAAVGKNLDDQYDDDNKIVSYGLKSKKKNIIKQQAKDLLTKTDWYVIKATEVESYSVPENITQYRTDIRTKSNEMEQMIDDANSVKSLKELFDYTEQEDGSVTRPLGEFPKEVI
tara:strand:+ start:228 stop:809 length:582 start_codon:yes stop_codon:yes gene_type:complete